MRFRLPPFPLILLALAATLGACNDAFSVARDRNGFVSAITRDAGGGAYALVFSGAFYRYAGLTAGIGTVDTCIPLLYSPTPPTLASLPTLDAGAELTTQVSGREDAISRSTAFGFYSYELAAGISIPFTPGDTLTLTIPGTLNGFPAAVVRTRTAEPFTFSPVGNNTAGAGLPINWTAAPAPGSMIVFSLRFNSTGVSPIPDSQIQCQFVDDGTALVPAGYASQWSASQPESRSVVAQRIRHSTVEVDSRTRVTLLSIFDNPTTPVDP